MRLAALLPALAACTALHADDKKPGEATATAVAEGVGKTGKGARAAAFRDAVSKVVGEKIIESGGGFYNNHDSLKTEKTADDLVRVCIEAVAPRRSPANSPTRRSRPPRSRGSTRSPGG